MELQGNSNKLNILVLCDLPRYSTNANTLFDHAYALRDLSRHNVKIYSRKGSLPFWINLDWFDAIVIHYSHFILGENYLSFQTKRRIGDFKGVKAIFIQDEYRFVRPINSEIKKMGIGLIFSCIAEPEVRFLYPEETVGKVAIRTVLTGYVPRDLPKMSPKISDRKITVSYRGRKLPYWYGSVAQEKWEIVPKFLSAAKVEPAASEWTLDLSYSEADRIYGEKWTEFLQDSRVTLGVESAASVIDLDGTLSERVEKFQTENPQATFEIAANTHFPDQDMKVHLRCISPRCFEAIATKTPLVLYEGEYSGILQAWQHYIPLKKDFSNFREVALAINDLDQLQQMADRAYGDIIASEKYGYSHLAKVFDEGIESSFEALSPSFVRQLFNDKKFQRQINLADEERPLLNAINAIQASSIQFGLLFTIRFLTFKLVEKIAFKYFKFFQPAFLLLVRIPFLSKPLRKIRGKMRKTWL